MTTETAYVREVATPEQQEANRYRLRTSGGDPRPQRIVEFWQLTDDRDRIVAADFADLLFVDENWSEARDVIRELDQRYGVPTPLTCCSGTSPFYGHSTQKKLPKTIDVWNFQWYPGGHKQQEENVREAAELATNSPLRYVCVDGGALHEYEEVLLWDRQAKKYEVDPRRLEAYGCYLRYSDNRDQWEVVYDPKIVERRIKRKSKSKVAYKPTHLTVSEFNDLHNALSRRISHETCVYVEQHYGDARQEMLCALRRSLALFLFFFKPGHHRLLKEFQKFIAEWKKRGELTRKAFQRNRGYVPLFDWFDQEAERRKPSAKRLAGPIELNKQSLKRLPFADR
jgi:hypothetical protein